VAQEHGEQDGVGRLAAARASVDCPAALAKQATARTIESGSLVIRILPVAQIAAPRRDAAGAEPVSRRAASLLYRRLTALEQSTDGVAGAHGAHPTRPLQSSSA